MSSAAEGTERSRLEHWALNYHVGNNDLIPTVAQLVRMEMRIWQRLRMPWMSESRILQYSIGHDFTNTIDIENAPIDIETQGDAYFDIDTGKFHVLDYIPGSHGDFAVAHTDGYFLHTQIDISPEDDVSHRLISLVETSVGHCILNAMRVMQRLWRTGRPQHMASSRDMLAAKCTSSFAFQVFSLQALQLAVFIVYRQGAALFSLPSVAVVCIDRENMYLYRQRKHTIPYSRLEPLAQHFFHPFLKTHISTHGRCLCAQQYCYRAYGRSTNRTGIQSIQHKLDTLAGLPAESTRTTSSNAVLARRRTSRRPRDDSDRYSRQH